MLDRLLGRAGLRERVEELEAERADLEAQLAAEQERKADAVSDRQRAQERANRLEDRVTELEDRVQRLQGGEEAARFRHEESLTGDRVGEVLDRLRSFETGPEGVLTAYVPEGADLPGAVRTALGERASLVSRAAPCLVVADDAGLLAACLSVPVPPEPFVTWDSTVDLEASWFRPTGSYAVALVRSDLFALGEYEGRERVAFHGFDADLKSQHSKGGFSQSRFERLRDQQIDSHVDRSLAAVAERSTDPLFVVGESTVLDAFEEEAAVTRAVDATGDPEAALADAVHDLWTVRLRVP